MFHSIPVLIASGDDSILSLILDADLIVQGVLLTLVGMSVYCWVIIFQSSTAFEWRRVKPPPSPRTLER